MSTPTFELQSHSDHSDGELSATALVAAAAEAGVELLALTDHDSVEGVAAARSEAGRLGLGFVTGVEISVLDPGGTDLHICGYLVDVEDPKLAAVLERSRADRQQRAQRMADALRELGFAIDERQLAARAEAGQTIGRPHLAQAVVSHPANAERLAAEGLHDPSELLEAYLIEGRPAFRERQAPTAAEAIGLIHDAGGVAVWAHPFWDIDANPEVLQTLDRFVADGLDGVEAFYVTHSPEQTRMLAERAAELELLSTGSSDFHGPHHGRFNRLRAFDSYGLEPNLGPLTDS